MSNIKERIEKYLITDKGKLNNWALRDYWIRKNNLESLMADIDNSISYPVDMKTKIYAHILHNGVIPKCKKCGSAVSYHSSYKKFSEYCSKECWDSSLEKSEKGRQNINLEKLKNSKTPESVRKTHENQKKALIEKYGVDNPSKIPEVRNKISQKIKGIQRKSDRDNHPSCRNLSNQQINYLNNPEKIYQEHISREIPITKLSIEKGFAPSTLYNLLVKEGYQTKCFYGSYEENIVCQWLDEIDIDYIKNDRNILKPKEIDIWIPDYNLAIEVNGLYWHCDERKHKNHLLKKKNEAKEQGINLLHFYDVEINNIAKSIIFGYLNKNNKIYARKCVIDNIDSKTYREFTNNNHIHGYAAAKIKKGLFYNGELVAVIGLSKTRYHKNDYLEIVRYCNKVFTNVLGGFSKLLKSIEINKPIISYSDKRLFEGTMYKKTGFKYSHDTNLNYYYFSSSNYKLGNRIKYQKHKLKDKLDNFNKNKSEYENMLNNGYHRVWDCGNGVWIKRNN